MKAQPEDDPARVLAAFLDAFARLDWEAFRGYFADDAEVFFPIADEPLRADGRAAIERLFAGVFARAQAVRSAPPYLDLEPHNLHIRRFGEMTVATFHLYDPGVLCRRTLVLHRDADAGWRIVHLHASNLPFERVM